MMKIDLTNVSRHAKALVLFLFAPLMSQAQTASSFYQPGVTTEGAVYFLPKTAVRVTVQVEKTTYTPGDFCKYAERYLRVKGVSPTPSVSYRITTIRQEAVAVADTSKRYAVEFNAKTSASNVNLSSDGILLSINTDPVRRPSAKSFTPAPRPAAVNPRQYMSEEILAAGSTAKMAELTAQDIYEIRESRNLLVRGQADNMPKDGEQLRLMLNQLDLQDRSMTSLFTGITTKDTTEHTLTVVPDREVNRELLFRFSSKLGIVRADRPEKETETSARHLCQRARKDAVPREQRFRDTHLLRVCRRPVRQCGTLERCPFQQALHNPPLARPPLWRH